MADTLSQYTPPELLTTPDIIHTPVDIWCLGLVVVELCNKQLPWANLQADKADEELQKWREHTQPIGHADMHDFVMCCLQQPPQKRPQAAELLHHPFVKQVVALV
eukprot:TRINITY_DN53887_c0_g2_i1.p4 TRINITY_DN53887_c0_g2~~TRINITY_DN53887_c0_g2_i1.p4  ORF type:complete len:118 (+),score=16.37 TRINITY_DN53887_c0_g2_i1:41-355(+)